MQAFSTRPPTAALEPSIRIHVSGVVQGDLTAPASVAARLIHQLVVLGADVWAEPHTAWPPTPPAKDL